MRLGFLFMYNNVISPLEISPADCGDSRCLGIHPTLCPKCTTPLFPIKDFIYDAPSCRQRSFTSLTEDTSGSQKNPLGMSTVMLQPCARWLGENQDPCYNSTLGKGWDCWELLPGALHSPSTHSIPGWVPLCSGMCQERNRLQWAAHPCPGSCWSTAQGIPGAVPAGSRAPLLLGRGGNGRL